MNGISSRFARGLAMGIFALSGILALAGLSQAQTAAPPPSASHAGTHASTAPTAHTNTGMQAMEGMRGMKGMSGMRAMCGGKRPMHMMHDVARLKTSLRLTPEQAALWARAEQQMKPPADLREQMKAQHERMAAMLDDPNFDPRKLAADMDRMQSERMARHKAMREAWFAVYDQLDPVQRGQVREFLRSHMARAERMRGHMGSMHRGMHGGHDKGMPAPR